MPPHGGKAFENIPKGILALTEIALGMFPTEQFEHIQTEVTVLACVSVFIIIVLIFLLNLLIAQLNCAYQECYQDMLGFARLNRCKIVVESMGAVAHGRWDKFVAALHLDQRLEFNDGDIGLSGGIQTRELANANPRQAPV